MIFTKTRKTNVNLELGLAAILRLVRNNKLPITSEMLEDFGKQEGLVIETVYTILNSERQEFFELNSVPKEWCLEKIVQIVIKKHRRIDQNKYKRLVNVVNELGLSFTFLDKSIKHSKLMLKS
jgi:hypothetical protein